MDELEHPIGSVVEYWINDRIEFGTIKGYEDGLYLITFCDTSTVNKVKPENIVE